MTSTTKGLISLVRTAVQIKRTHINNLLLLQFFQWWIYEFHIFELQKEQINAEKIRVKYAIYAVAKRKPPKNKILSITEVRVCILESLNIIRLSFCNCISCVFISSVTLTATSSFQGLQHLAIFCALSWKKIYGASNPRTEPLRQHHDTHVHGFIY